MPREPRRAGAGAWAVPARRGGGAAASPALPSPQPCGREVLWARTGTPAAASPTDTCPRQVRGQRAALPGSRRCTQTSDPPWARRRRWETLVERRKRSTGNAGIWGGGSMKSSGLLSPARVPQAVSQQSSARCLAGGSAAARSAVPGKGWLPGRGHCPATGQSWSGGEKPRRFTADGKGGEQPRHGAPLCSLAFSAFQWATTLNPWARRRGTHRGDAAGAPLRSPGGCFGGVLLCLA